MTEGAETASALPEQVLDVLRDASLSLSAAESLTGGRVAAALTDAPGASAVFRGGVVAYASDVKQSVLGVPADVVEDHGVVSAPCAEAMAAGVRDLMGADVGLATTGVAGPDRQEDKPVGTVFIAVSRERGTISRRLDLSGERADIVAATVDAVLRLALDTATDPQIADRDREEPPVG